MGQEYFINSQDLQNKVSSLLPSQGGAGAGFDLSASTQIVPIIDLTESAEGSDVRPDLQRSLSFTSITSFDVANTTSTIISNTGYYRIIGSFSTLTNTSSSSEASFTFTDGASTKDMIKFRGTAGTGSDTAILFPYDFNVFLKAGESLQAITNKADAYLQGSTRQIADIDGNLVDP